jgi:hypothetical protein
MAVTMKIPSFGMLRRVTLLITDVSEEHHLGGKNQQARNNVSSS